MAAAPEQTDPAELPPERHELLAKVASLYYEDNLTQVEIAARVGVSRSSVSRLLSEARDMGVVHISIRWPADTTGDLSTQLAQHYPGVEVHVVRAGGRGYTQTVEVLGGVAASLLEDKLKDGDVLGISWHTGVYQVAEAFRAARKLGVKVVQLTGSTGVINPVIDGPDLARWLAQILGGQYHYIPAPLIVDSPSTRNALLKDRTISERLEMAYQCNMALVGIGTVFPPLCNLYQLGYLTESQLDDIVEQGGVGEILTYFYDIEGKVLPLPIHERTIGLPLERLRDVPTVIGVAAGKEQAQAIVGALRGGYITCLVIDDEAANKVLAITEQMAGGRDEG